jgi:transcriptional regulator with XRE-family HTH domain
MIRPVPSILPFIDLERPLINTSASFRVSNLPQSLAEAPSASGGALEPFLNKDYREAYLEEFVKSSIAHQIRALREKLKMTQTQFAEKLGTKQNVVSRLEDEDYGSVTVNTLLRVAKRNDVALNVRFVDFPTMLATDVSIASMTPNSISESYEKERLRETTKTNVIDNPTYVILINGPVAWRVEIGE